MHILSRSWKRHHSPGPSSAGNMKWTSVTEMCARSHMERPNWSQPRKATRKAGQDHGDHDSFQQKGSLTALPQSLKDHCQDHRKRQTLRQATARPCARPQFQDHRKRQTLRQMTPGHHGNLQDHDNHHAFAAALPQGQEWYPPPPRPHHLFHCLHSNVSARRISQNQMWQRAITTGARS